MQIERSHLKIMAIVLFTLALALSASTGAAALNQIDTSEQSPSQLHFTVVGSAEVNPMDGNQSGRALYDFGRVNRGKTLPIQHIFVLRNDNKTSLTLTGLKTSCGCTHGEVLPAVGGKDVVIAPGEQVRVLVSTDPQRVRLGSTINAVLVMVKEQAAPAAFLEMKGVMSTGVSFVPTTLDFGNFSRGAEPSLPLIALVDGDLGAMLPNFHLRSTNSDIVVGEPVMGGAESGRQKVSYLIKISPHAGTGLLTGTLSMPGPNSFEPLATVLIRGNVKDDGTPHKIDTVK